MFFIKSSLKWPNEDCADKPIRYSPEMTVISILSSHMRIKAPHFIHE